MAIEPPIMQKADDKQIDEAPANQDAAECAEVVYLSIISMRQTWGEHIATEWKGRIKRTRNRVLLRERSFQERLRNDAKCKNRRPVRNKTEDLRSFPTKIKKVDE